MSATKIISFSNLSDYDALIKTYIGDADDVVNAKSIKTVLWDSTNEQIKFFKKENATLADTADYAVSISSSDVQDLQTRVGMTTTLNGYNSATDLTSIMNILTANSSTTGSVAKAEADAKSYADGLIAALDADVDASGTAQHSGTFVVSGITEVDGVITGVDSAEVETAGAAAALAATLATVATSGDADDVNYDNTTSGLTATDVQSAIDELAEASAGGVASKTVYMVASGSTSDYAQVYDIYQGATGSSASPVPAEKIGSVNIPKDKVVESGSVGTVTTPDVPYPGAKVGDKYIELVLQNVANPLYIPANSLVDIYTGGTTTEATVTIDNNNEITVTIGEINGSKLAATSVAKGKLATGVQDSLDLADSAVQSVAEGATNGTVAVDGTDVAVHGLGSAAYTASSAYDAAGSAAQALSDAEDYADGLYEIASSADIEGLFPTA